MNNGQVISECQINRGRSRQQVTCPNCAIRLQYIRDTLMDTIHIVVTYSEEISRNDTNFVAKKDLPAVMIEGGFIADLGFETKQRSEVVSYYDSYMPDSSNFYCPLTREKIAVNLKDEGEVLRVASPIEGIYSEGRYLLFSFKTRNHGYIEDGSRSWDQ